MSISQITPAQAEALAEQVLSQPDDHKVLIFLILLNLCLTLLNGGAFLWHYLGRRYQHRKYTVNRAKGPKAG
jgi:hypothetical protein